MQKYKRNYRKDEELIYEDDFNLVVTRKNYINDSIRTVYFKRNSLYFEGETKYDPFDEVLDYMLRNDFIYEIAESDHGNFTSFIKKYVNICSLEHISIKSFQKNGYTVIYFFNNLLFNNEMINSHIQKNVYVLPSGQISMSDVNVELGRNHNSSIDLNNGEVRNLAAKPSGTISLADLRGKSNGTNNIWFNGQITLHKVFFEEWDWDTDILYRYSNHSIFAPAPYTRPMIKTGNFDVIGVYSDWVQSVDYNTVNWTETYVGITVVADRASNLIEYIQLRNGASEVATLVPYQTSTHAGRNFEFFGSWYFFEPGYGNCSEYQWWIFGSNEFFMPTFSATPLGQQKPFGVRIKRR